MLPLTLALIALQNPEVETGPSYFTYVAAESEDVVTLTRFDAGTGKLTVVERIPVGYQTTEIEGPHGLTVAPDGKHWYLSMAHGQPYGFLYKYETGTNKLVGRCELGLFPATMQISAATGLLYCVNFDLHGDMSPSSVSIVDPDEMVEVQRVVTGPMPHGSRISPDGLHHYSCSMMADTLFEIDAAAFEVSRRLFLTTREDEEAPPLPPLPGMGDMGGDMSGGMGGASPDGPDGGAPEGGMEMRPAVAKPTWVYPHPTRSVVYVALNGAAQVVEVDTERWEITRRFETPKGPYNVEVSPDGRHMLVSYKSSQSMGIWNLESGTEAARLESSKKVTHGVAISSDSRYGFVSNESIGGDPGTLDVVDLEAGALVASVEVGLQAGGIAFWKVER